MLIFEVKVYMDFKINLSIRERFIGWRNEEWGEEEIIFEIKGYDLVKGSIF